MTSSCLGLNVCFADAPPGPDVTEPWPKDGTPLLEPTCQHVLWTVIYCVLPARQLHVLWRCRHCMYFEECRLCRCMCSNELPLHVFMMNCWSSWMYLPRYWTDNMETWSKWMALTSLSEHWLLGVERFTSASVYHDFSVHGTICDSQCPYHGTP